ncbi:MAG TPA: 3-isopropylmalate dehydratase small subunit [Thermohalobaculum sp.]|nr:3-isopropylmalate dehydratase small subunit [Thermohalobaculum sp.]
MERFTTLTGVAAPLLRGNIDTDTIIPQRWCKSVTRTGFGAHLFHDLRFDGAGAERADFVLNRAPWRAAAILVAGANFGCGSSREAAVWALHEFGVRCLIAPSFSDIFARNCVANGVLPVTLDEDRVARLAALAGDPETAALSVDLPAQTIVAGGEQIPFEMDPYVRHRLINGLDEIAVTLTHEPEIAAHERWLGAARRWRLPARG